MPLRDHFRPPVDDFHSWDGLHGMWPATMVRQLIEVMPEPYFATPGIRLGTLFEVDIGTFRTWQPESEPSQGDTGEGGVAVATYAPPKPTLIVEPQIPKEDVYEVLIYDSRRHRQLLAAIEIISPSNKDRPKVRIGVAAKVATLLLHGICVTIVDVVSTKYFNLYAELMSYIESSDPALGDEPPPMYAATVRPRIDDDDRRFIDTWYHPLEIGQPLPTLPIWLKENWAVPLDLESGYEETCRALRIR